MKHVAAVMGLMVAGVATAATPPDLTGFWTPAAKITALRTVDGAAPPLTAAGRTVYDQHLAAAARGDRSWDNELQCRPPGVPRLVAESPFEIAQTPKTELFLYQWNRLQRPVDIRAHTDFDRAYPYYLGHPAGSWQGDTLVIDSIYFNKDTVLDSTGLPHSDALHVVEHMKLLDADTLQDTVTIDDPKMYTKSWQTVLRFKRMPADTRLPEDVCVERLGLKDLNTNSNRRPKD